jgi:hypothetical protein
MLLWKKSPKAVDNPRLFPQRPQIFPHDFQPKYELDEIDICGDRKAVIR